MKKGMKIFGKKELFNIVVHQTSKNFFQHRKKIRFFHFLFFFFLLFFTTLSIIKGIVTL